MLRPRGVVVVVVAAASSVARATPPAWVTANSCVAEPAVDLACHRDPIAGASRHDLEACACELLAAAGLTGCDDLRASEGSELVIDRKLAAAIATATRDKARPEDAMLYRNQTLLAAVGALASMRTATVADDREIPYAVGACRRFVAQTGESLREDLVCSIDRAEPAKTPLQLAPHWPWCGGCSKASSSRALAFAMPATNVRYPAVFDAAASRLDGSQSNNTIQWACVTTTERTPDLQFGDAPISMAMTQSLTEFATVASVWAAPYVVDEISVGACTDVRLKTGPETRGLRTGDKLTLGNVRRHARGTSCDLERVTFRAPNGERVDIAVKSKSLVPFIERVMTMRWSELRDFALDVGVRHLYDELVDKVRADPVDRNILAILTRAALVESGLVVFDPLVKGGHDGEFHLDTSVPSPQPRPTLYEAANVAELNRAIQELDRATPKRERARVKIEGTSSDSFESLVHRQSQKWCANEHEATVTFDFLDPAPATRLHAWSDDGTVTVTADDKPWQQMTHRDGYFGFTGSAPVHTLTVRVKSPRQACIHFVLEGRHVGDVGESHDLEIERVTRTDDLVTLDPFIDDLDRAIGSCSLTTLPRVVQLPVVVEYRRWNKTVTRTYKTPRELVRACLLDELPRPTRALDLATDGVKASQQIDDHRNHAAWSYRVIQGHWRLVSARFAHDDT